MTWTAGADTGQEHRVLNKPILYTIAYRVAQKSEAIFIAHIC